MIGRRTISFDSSKKFSEDFNSPIRQRRTNGTNSMHKIKQKSARFHQVFNDKQQIQRSKIRERLILPIGSNQLRGYLLGDSATPFKDFSNSVKKY